MLYLMTIRRQIDRESRTGLRVAGTPCSRPVLGVPVPVAAIEGEKAEEGAPCVIHRPLQVLQKEPFLTGARRITHSTRRGGVSHPRSDDDVNDDDAQKNFVLLFFCFCFCRFVHCLVCFCACDGVGAVFVVFVFSFLVCFCFPIVFL